jgi:thioredoxin reductase
MNDVIIIGGGIAGCTAAIYASRKKSNFLLVTKDLGGQFMESGEILNYPGIVKTDGAEMAERFEKQLEANGIEPVTGEEIKSVKRIEKGFAIESDKNRYQARSLIIATGSVPRRLGVPGEKELANRGVTYCSVCDGPLFSGKKIAIIGGGNSALEAVDFTKDIVSEIVLINNTDKFNGFEYLIEKVNALDKAEVIHNAEVKEIRGGDDVESLIYEKEGRSVDVDVDGVIIEIGRKPITGLVEGFLELTGNGHISIDCQGRTSQEGVFAAGDCASGQEFQYAVAAGQGCIAFLKAARYLAENVRS